MINEQDNQELLILDILQILLHQSIPLEQNKYIYKDLRITNLI
jgi:hypothetical protein